MMMTLFRPNLQPTGRWIRALAALVLSVGAIAAWPWSPACAVVLGISAAFVGFEAARGWCVLRACGVKTRM
jgi:hypothetical protein